MRQQAIDAETVRVVARRGPLKIVETRHGWVVAAAGIDASNTAADSLVLLPADADASARRLRAGLRERLGVDVAVVISDTFGRTWREGLTDVAVGSAGLLPLVDHRGEVDAHGNRLETTQVAVVDELAAAADLVKGKLARVPVAVVRGWRHTAPVEDTGNARAGAAGARGPVRPGHPRRRAHPTPDTRGHRATGRARRGGRRVPGGVGRAARVPGRLRLRRRHRRRRRRAPHRRPSTTTALNLGALLGAALVQLHAEGWATRWEPVGTPGGSSLVGRLRLGSTG